MSLCSICNTRFSVALGSEGIICDRLRRVMIPSSSEQGSYLKCSLNNEPSGAKLKAYHVTCFRFMRH